MIISDFRCQIISSFEFHGYYIIVKSSDIKVIQCKICFHSLISLKKVFKLGHKFQISCDQGQTRP